jgi:hypothetical protein
MKSNMQNAASTTHDGNACAMVFFEGQKQLTVLSLPNYYTTVHMRWGCPRRSILKENYLSAGKSPNSQGSITANQHPSFNSPTHFGYL